MRTTIDLPDDLRRRVVSEAAARNLRGYSQVIVEALRAYFDGGQDERQSVLTRVRGSLNPHAAEIEGRRLAELRANWRT
jgi:metal-responsive CopG/Arc/MetJ family transcriptional regulator